MTNRLICKRRRPLDDNQPDASQQRRCRFLGYADVMGIIFFGLLVRDFAVTVSPQLDGMTKTYGSFWAVEEQQQHQQQQSKDRTKPTIYIHVGPPKTGTTTTQTALTVWKDSLLENDGIEYLGFHMWPNGTWRVYDTLGSGVAELSGGCISDMTKPCYRTVLDKLRDKYSHDKARNKDGIPNDLILSDEVFTRSRYLLGNQEGLERFQENIKDMYNLQVIVAYRRFEDWFPSARRQVNLRSQKPSYWIGPIPPQFPQALKLARRNSHSVYPAPAELIQLLKQRSTLNIEVYNFHENSDLFQTFACGVLHAQQTCKLSRSPNATKVFMTFDKSVKENLLYDEIVSMAADAGILNKIQYHRKIAVHAARIWHQEIKNRTANELPMKCPSKAEMDEYLQLSLAIERDVLPDFAAKREKAHIQAFWDAAAAKTYCSVDTDTVLKDSEWLEFFQSVIQRVRKLPNRVSINEVRKRLMISSG
jgi:hypothetical protein